MVGSAIAKSFGEWDDLSLVARLTAAPSVAGPVGAAAVQYGPQRSDPLVDQIDLQNLVARIYRGEDSGMEDLYKIFAQGIRFYLCRQFGPQDLDDKVHDIFLIVVQAIQKGSLRAPECLMGFVRTVVRRQIAGHIGRVVHSRREEFDLDLDVRVADVRRNPEQSAAFQQRIELMVSVLDNLSTRDRDILSRYYLDEQSQEEICKEMSLSETQFRLLKSRAKGRFAALGKRKVLPKRMGSPYLLTAASLSAGN